MKTLLLGIFSSFLFLNCSSYTRIGDLNSISNRNIDNSKTYVMLERNIETIVKQQKDALEVAIDQITNEHDGEYLQNIQVFVKNNGKKVKIVGDVWGIQKANVDLDYQIGTPILFEERGKNIKGKIIGIKQNTVIIEYLSGKKTKTKELKYSEITKTQ